MRLELSSEQRALRETTARFLDDHSSPDQVRALRDDSEPVAGSYWTTGAQLGWTSLLVSEDNGGGSVSGDGLIDLTLVAHEFGRHAAPGPLLPVNIVAGALNDAGSHAAFLSDLVSGAAVATWAYAEGPPHDGLGSIALDIVRDGDELVVNGTKRPVEAAGQADQLLVTGRTGDGLTQVLIPRDTPGVALTPLTTVDLTRRFAAVEFTGVRVPVDAAVGEIGKAQDDVERQLLRAVVIANAESTAAMDAAFALTLGWARDRYSFGRPLASYQALKHRFADMKSWLEAAHAIGDEAAEALATGAANAPDLVSAAKAFIGEYGSELIQDCVQLHGGIGVTFEHNLHLYLRRHTLNRSMYGTPAEHKRRLADNLRRRESVA